MAVTRPQKITDKASIAAAAARDAPFIGVSFAQLRDFESRYKARKWGEPARSHKRGNKKKIKISSPLASWTANAGSVARLVTLFKLFSRLFLSHCVKLRCRYKFAGVGKFHIDISEGDFHRIETRAENTPSLVREWRERTDPSHDSQGRRSSRFSSCGNFCVDA